MRKMDSLGLKMCSYQAALFEKSAVLTDCSSKIFMRRFMNSELARRMDDYGFMFEALDVTDAIVEIEHQYGKSSYGSEKFSAEELYWMGYITRYWSYVTGKPTRRIYKLIKPEQLRKLYFPYHSLDPLQAIERITEDIEPEEYKEADDIARGVVILRKVRSKYTSA